MHLSNNEPVMLYWNNIANITRIHFINIKQ